MMDYFNGCEFLLDVCKIVFYSFIFIFTYFIFYLNLVFYSVVSHLEYAQWPKAGYKCDK